MQSQEGLRKVLEDEIEQEGDPQSVEKRPFQSRVRFSREARGME